MELPLINNDFGALVVNVSTSSINAVSEPYIGCGNDVHKMCGGFIASRNRRQDERNWLIVFKKWQQEANFYPDVKLYRATSKARQREVKDAVKVANEGVSSTLEATGVTYVRLGRGSCYRFVVDNSRL